MDDPDVLAKLRQNLERVRAGIAAACQRAGRDPAAVVMVAVTKYVSPTVIRGLLAAGVRDLGENRVQQLVARAAELGSAPQGWPGAPDPVATPSTLPRWHMIGHLQRNKVRQVLTLSRIIHSLDSPRLAMEIEGAAAHLEAPVDAFLEINLAGETSKTGAPPNDLDSLVAATRACPHIRLRGLMTMPPLDPDPEHSRPYFARLRQMLARLQRTGAVGPECVHLSMGMSQDYAAAIEEGATFIRIGSALFEDLPPQAPGPGPAGSR